MFCTKCGKEVNDGVKFCPFCGQPMTIVGQVKDAASDVFDSAEAELGQAIDDVQQSFSGNTNTNNGNNQNNGYNANNGNTYQQQYGNPTYVAPFCGERLQTDRSLGMYILLSIVTLGIYSYYFLYKLAHDVNIACDGDGESTSGLVAFILLSFITCGIYAWFWYYGIGNRLASNAPRYNMQFQENGTTVLLWQIFGALLCGIGPFIAMHILIKNSNKICGAYNQAHGL